MSRTVRFLTRLMIGMSALVLTGVGGAAFAQIPPPDGNGTQVVQTFPAPVTPVSGSGMSAWVVLLIAAGAIALGVALTEIAHRARRHQPRQTAATA
jgi:hypothetical protein